MNMDQNRFSRKEGTKTLSRFDSYPCESAFICGCFLVVGVGIEPTSRVFQTHANPSQLSDRRHCRLPIFDCRLAGRKLLSIGNWHSAFGNELRPSVFARHAPSL